MSGEVVLVTGGAAGIGRATAIAFARAGAETVVVADVDERGGTEAAAAVTAAGAKGEFVRTDVSRADEVEALVDGIVERHGRIDVGVNNAGIEGTSAPLWELAEADWDRVLDVNAKSAFLCMRAELRHMVARKKGAIVNVSSAAGVVGFSGAAPYVASKHAIVGLTKSAALDVARAGVRVNTVAPGVVRTAMIDRVTHRDPAIETAMGEMQPVGRMGTPEEIAAAILWLASDGASFVTGEVLSADGGLVAR